MEPSFIRASCGSTLAATGRRVGLEFVWRRATTEQHERNGSRTTINASGETTADAMEQRVLAFAEQLGRIAGTFQAKTEGWMDLEALNKQIASVRDSAAELLEQLAAGARKSRGKAGGAARRNQEDGAAAWSTQGARNIVSRWRPIRAQRSRTVRRAKCGWQRRWSRRTGVRGRG